jgi:hypothetical protein
MTFSLKAIFHRDDQYEGVCRINIYLLPLVFNLNVLRVGEGTVGRKSSPIRDFGGLRNLIQFVGPPGFEPGTNRL